MGILLICAGAVAHLGGAETRAPASSPTGVPLGRPATPADIAPAHLYLASDGARDLTAKTITIDGGLIS